MRHSISAIPATPLILLAGGRSSRAGKPKGLLPYQGRPWIHSQVEFFRALGGERVFLVLGYDIESYDAVALPELRKLTNPHPEHGPFSSIRTGAQAALEEGFSSAFVLPIDVPVPASEVWQALAQALEPGVRICQPVITLDGADHGGHPVLLAAEEMKHILKMKPTDRLDLRIHELGPAELRRVPAQDPRIVLDLNTPESWDKFVKDRL